MSSQIAQGTLIGCGVAFALLAFWLACSWLVSAWLDVDQPKATESERPPLKMSGEPFDPIEFLAAVEECGDPSYYEPDSSATTVDAPRQEFVPKGPGIDYREVVRDMAIENETVKRLGIQPPKFPEPIGLRFYDLRSGREMIFVHEGAWAGWLAYRHPEGQWVSLREATADDRRRLEEAASHSAILNSDISIFVDGVGRSNPRSGP